MTPSNFLSQLQHLIVGGTGFIKYIPMHLGSIRAATGAPIDVIGGGDFGLVAAETEALVLQWAATDVTEIILDIMVPLDYDSDTAGDVLKLALLAQMASDTDTPAMTAEAYLKRAGAALSADLAPASSAALSDAAAWVFIDLSGNSLQGGDIVQVKVAPAAHGTDALNLYGVAAVYKSCLVPFDVDDRS